MIRLSSVPPTTYNLGLLSEQALAQWPQLLGLNELNDGAEIAFYFPDDDVPSQADVDTFLAAHDGKKKSTSQLDREERDAITDKLKTASSSILDATPLGKVVHDILRYLDLRE